MTPVSAATKSRRDMGTECTLAGPDARRACCRALPPRRCMDSTSDERPGARRSRRDVVKIAVRAAIALPAASLLPNLSRASEPPDQAQDQQAAAPKRGELQGNAMKRHVVVVGAGAFG